eukprot:TRINITY_DN5910_c0_g1_i1.p1 TRINITY_DN5910_c0_g1~~TRINITY_DN5910_c0_g1_i1.p1  ORF type:complete len:207 (+),score=31.73 TRINITY_DN5910_c0_g1_i1:25-645(+)
MEKYFCASDTEFTLKYPPGGGRAGMDNAKQPFEIFNKKTGKPAIVSPADVRCTLTGPEATVVQTRGAANKFALYFKTNTAGLYTADIRIRNTSFTRTVYVHSETDPDRSYIEGERSTPPGRHYSVRVFLVDTLGQTLQSLLDDSLSVSLAGPEGTFENLSTTPQPDGTFIIGVDLLGISCNYELNIQLATGEYITGQPWKFSTTAH